VNKWCQAPFIHSAGSKPGPHRFESPGSRAGAQKATAPQRVGRRPRPRARVMMPVALAVVLAPSRLRRSACPGDRIARPDLENPSALFAVAARRPRGWVGGGKRCSVGQIILGEAVIVLSVAGVVLLVAFHWHSVPSHSVYPRTSNAADQPECRNGPIRRVGREHAQTHRPENIPLSRAGRLASRVPRRPRRHARRRASACDPGRSAPKAVAPRVQSSR
jgi:hypothetical protein